MIDVLKDKKAVIFDWDGTLVDSTDWVIKAHNHVRKHFNLPLWTKDDIFSCSSLSTRELYPSIYGDRAQEALDLIWNFVKTHNLESALPYECAGQLLQTLFDHNMMMGVVSNKRHDPLHEVINHLKWRHFFTGVVGAGHSKRDKPSEIPLLDCMAQIDSDLKPADILYVGDTETDLLTAQNAACDVVFIQSDQPHPDLIEKYTPIASYDDLNGFLTGVMSIKRPQVA